MPRQLQSLACTIALAAGALHCGAGSTAPVTNTPTANGSPSGIGSGGEAAASLAPEAATDGARGATASAAEKGGATAQSATEASRAEPATTGAAPSEENEAVASNDGSAQASAPLSDAEIIAITDAFNAAQLERARLARSKGRDPRIKDYAAMMLDHHGRAREEQAQLGVDKVETSRSTSVTRDALSTYQRLQQKKGAEFDRAYIDLQIASSAAALERIDRELLPAARDARVKSYLENVKPRLELHLTKAQQIQEELASPGVDPRLTTTQSGTGSR